MVTYQRDPLVGIFDGRPQFTVRDPDTQNIWVNRAIHEKLKKMWCNCGALDPGTRYEGPFSAPRKPVTWTFSGADDGIRTRDPNLGKVIGSNSATCIYAYRCSTMRLFDLP